ncbi:Cinful1 polyprotein [Panicum miliaceum]|uniref:Cinful1 polyprotein n=1 Tax=Panicum miliaceum TaxID=4540 RepID=A0A3L6TK65_PANMI|nr:Cinful1 polyprotein [Panicum miliaceum]
MRTEVITFDIVDIHYPYNAIFGRNTIIKFVVIINQPYLCMKIPTTGGVLSIFGNQEESRRCEDNTSHTSKNVHAIKDQEQIEGTPSHEELDASEGLKAS